MQSFKARSRTNIKLSPFNCQWGASLVTGDFLRTKRDPLANESCLLDRRQGLQKDPFLKEWFLHRNETCSLLEIWCGVYNVVSVSWFCSSHCNAMGMAAQQSGAECSTLQLNAIHLRVDNCSFSY